MQSNFFVRKLINALVSFNCFNKLLMSCSSAVINYLAHCLVDGADKLFDAVNDLIYVKTGERRRKR